MRLKRLLCALLPLILLMHPDENQLNGQTITNTNNNFFTDSILSQLNSPQCDTMIMPQLFNTIKEKRKELKTNYLPLLRAYTFKAKHIAYPEGEMMGLDRIGLQYRFDKAFDSSIYYHNKALEIALLIDDKKQQYYIYNNLGQVYRLQDLNVQAITYYHKALAISDIIGDEKSSSYTLNSLGAAYAVQKEYAKANYYYSQSAKIAKKRNDTRTLGHTYTAMGQLFIETNQLDSARQYLQNASNILEISKWDGSYAITNTTLAQVYYEEGDFKQAEILFHQALPKLQSSKKTMYQAFAYAYIAKIKLKNNENDSALFYLKKAEAISLAIHSHKNLELIYSSYFDYYQNTKQWQKAINALQYANSYNDSMISIANAKELQSLEIIYETAKKEQQIALLSAQNEINNQRIKLASFLLVLLVLTILIGVYIHNMRKQNAQNEQDILKQQLMLSQMNPHFIFNALGSIQSFMYRNDGKKAAQYMGNFAALSRSILNNSSEEYISLDEEIKTLTNYLELEKMRMQAKFNYHMVLDEDVDSEFINIPPMMLQPFVENAIKHGLKNLSYQGELTIKIEDKNHYLHVEIEDNGIGFNEASKNKDETHQSKATKIFNQRMKILNRKFSNIPAMEIIDLNKHLRQGTKVIVNLPIYNE